MNDTIPPSGVAAPAPLVRFPAQVLSCLIAISCCVAPAQGEAGVGAIPAAAETRAAGQADAVLPEARDRQLPAEGNTQGAEAARPQASDASQVVSPAPDQSQSKETEIPDTFAFVQDGEISQNLKIPTYEWFPKTGEPKGMTLAVHGLTLHGRRYEILGRAFATGEYYLMAPDMRGFGRCRTDTAHQFCEGKDCKGKIDHEKSYQDLVKVAQLMKQKYPGRSLTLMGESLGTTFCIRMAGEHPELVDGIVLSGPTVRIHPLMVFHPGSIAAGLEAIFFSSKGEVKLDTFVKELVSDDPHIVTEMLNDKLVLKELTLGELIHTDEYVSKTESYAKTIQNDMPILILQGSLDKCVVPDAVVKLSKSVGSSDQTLRWLAHHGHLLLETAYLRAATIGAIFDWFVDHDDAHRQELKEVEDTIRKLGGLVRK